MKNIRVIFLILFLIVYIYGTSNAKTPIPGRTGFWINDYAGIIDLQTKEYLEEIISSFNQKTPDPVEIIVAIFKSVEGWDLKEFSIKYGEKWREIKKGRRDNGVILLVILDKGAVNIGVGQNLKGILTNDIVNNIINNKIIPRFDRREFSEGIKEAVEEIIDILENAEIPYEPLFTPKKVLIAIIFILLLYFLQRGSSSKHLPLD